MNLSYFKTTNENGETVTKHKPEQKSLADVKRLLRLGKKQKGIDDCIELMLASEQWIWFDKYNKHLENLAQVNAFNANLPVISQAENGDDIFAEPKDLPDEPIRPALLTVEEFKAANKVLFDSYNKKQGIVINGVKISLGNANADGLMQIKTFYDIAKEVAGDLAESMVFPTNLDAKTASGEVKVPINTYNEFIQYSLQFAAARSEFF